MAFLLMSRDGQESSFLLDSFQAGYEWGKHAEMFLISTSDEVREPVLRAAAAYSARQDLASFEADELGRAAAIIEHFRDVLPVMGGSLITSGEATDFSGSRDGFESWVPDQQLDEADAELVSTARGFFDCGASFYAFETQVLLALRRLGRVERLRS